MNEGSISLEYQLRKVEFYISNCKDVSKKEILELLKKLSIPVFEMCKYCDLSKRWYFDARSEHGDFTGNEKFKILNYVKNFILQ